MTGAGDRGPGRDRLRTDRLLIRCWRRGDAPRLAEAIAASLPELRLWLPWAAGEPVPIAELELRLEVFRIEFEAGRDWTYGLFDPGETRVLGGAGLHRRAARDALEIGYWIRTDETGRGLATEAAAALAGAGLAAPGVDRIEIRCDPRNARSSAVPRRLGFVRLATLPADPARGGGRTATEVWSMSRDAWAALRPGPHRE